MCPYSRSRLGRPGGSAAKPCDVTILAPRSVPPTARNLPTRVISRRSRTRRYAMIAAATSPGRAAADSPSPASLRRAGHDLARLRPRCGGESPGHFRLSGCSPDRRRPASEPGISNTTVASSSTAGAAAGASFAAGVASAGARASSAPSDHGTAGTRGAVPSAAGSAFRPFRACAGVRVVAFAGAGVRTLRAGAGAGTGSAV